MATDDKRMTTKGGRVAAVAAANGDAAPRPTVAKKTLTDEQIATRLDELSGKAQRGDAKAWRDLRPILEKIPAWEAMYPTPADEARRALLEATIGSNPLAAAGWERRARTMTTELAGSDPSPLERILCERVATCWLEMSLTDLVYASRTRESLSLEAGEYYQRMKDRAHKRYLSACLALAQVRRLLAPVAQQINIAQPGASQLNVNVPAHPAASSPPAAYWRRPRS